MTDPLRSDPLTRTPAPVEPAPIDPYGMRPRGLGTGSGELLRESLIDTQPYETPIWARTLTYPAISAEPTPSTAISRGRGGFPVRVQAPNPFGGLPSPSAGMPGVLEGPLGVAIGAAPGEERGGAYNGFATVPMTVANFQTYGREGLVALLSSAFLGGAYQQPKGGGQFGQDIDYQGPDDPGVIGGAVKGIIEANKVVGDAVWGLLGGVQTFLMDEDAKFRANQVAQLFQSGGASRPVLPFERGFVANLTASIDQAIFGTVDRFSLQALQNGATAQGIDLISMVAQGWDLPYAVVAELARDPYMADERRAGLVAGVPWSQDAGVNMMVDFGYMGLLMMGGYAGVARGAAAITRLGRGPQMLQQFAQALNPPAAAARLAPSTLGGQAGRAAGFLTRKALQLNAINTAAGWSVRGFEWGVKQAAVIVGDDGLVKMMDNLLWEMPWSMNPGLNLIDGFTSHPLAHAKELRTGRLVIGAEGSYSEAFTIGRRPSRPVTPTGALDVDAVMAGARGATDEVPIEVGGRVEQLAPDHSTAVAINVFKQVGLDDIHARLLRGTGIQREWLETFFGADNKYGLTIEDLRNFLVYAYAQVVREEGFAAPATTGATLLERSREFVMLNSREMIDAIESDLRGDTTHLAAAMKGQWWELGALNDSRMAVLKARMAETYEPWVAFLNMAHWVAASKGIETAYRNVGRELDMVPTYARRINRPVLASWRQKVAALPARSRVKQGDIEQFRHDVGPVELYAPELSMGRRPWSRERLLELIDRIAKAQDESQATRATTRRDPHLRRDWEPGKDFDADARVMGITPEEVMLIREHVRTAEATTLPPRSLIERAAREKSLDVNALLRDPARAWDEVIAWYDDALAEFAPRATGRGQFLDMVDVLRARAGEGLIADELAQRAIVAGERLAAELLDPPRRRPMGNRAAPSGVTYADPDGLARWEAASSRAQLVASGARAHLEDPLSKVKLVDSGEGTTWAAVGGYEGVVRDLDTLVRYVRDNPGVVLIDSPTDAALLADMTAHPLLKLEALGRADWDAVRARGELRGELSRLAPEAGFLGESERLSRELATTAIPDIDPAIPVREMLDEVTSRAIVYRTSGEGIAQEMIDAARAFDTIYGRLSPESLALHDRLRIGGVEPERELRARPRQPRAVARTAAEELAAKQAQLDAIEDQLRLADYETGDLVFTPARRLDGTEFPLLRKRGKPEDPYTAEGVAASMHAITGLAYKVKRIGDAKRARWRVLEGMRAVEERPAPIRTVTGEVIEGTGEGELRAAEDAWLEARQAVDATQQRARDETFLTELAAKDPRAQLSEEARALLDADYYSGGRGWPEGMSADTDQMVRDLEGRVGHERVAEAQAELEAWYDAHPGWTAEGTPEGVPLVGAGGAIEQAQAAGDAELMARLNLEAEQVPREERAPMGTTINLEDPDVRAALEAVEQRATEGAAEAPRDVVAEALARLEEGDARAQLSDGARTLLDAEYNGVGTPEWMRQRAALEESIGPEGFAAAEEELRVWQEANPDWRPEGPAGTLPGEGEPAPVAPTPEPRYGFESLVADPMTEADRPIAGRFRLVEADELIDSWDDAYDQRIQPRETEDPLRQETLAAIADRPIPMKLLDAPVDASSGMPLVTPDVMVVVGNHRSRGLKLAYEAGRADEYRAMLLARAGDWGIDPAAVVAMRRPVLVREIPAQYARTDYASAWNPRGMSIPELAGGIGLGLRAEDLARFRVAEGSTIKDALKQPQNAALVQSIIKLIPQAARGTYTTGKALKNAGVELFQMALYARLLGGSAQVAEAAIDAIGRTSKPSGKLALALRDTAGQIIAAEARISLGQRLAEPLAPSLGRAFEIIDALEGFEPGAVARVDPARLRRLLTPKDADLTVEQRAALEARIEGISAEAEAIRGADIDAQIAFLAQGDEFVTGLATRLRKMGTQPKGRAEIEEFLETYAEAVKDAPDPTAMGLFAEMEPVAEPLYRTLNRAIESITAKRRAATGGDQGGLFGSDDIPLFPGPDNVVHHSFETPDGSSAVASEFPVIDVDAGITEQAAGADRVLIDSWDALRTVPEGTPVVFRTLRAREAEALRAAMELPDGELTRQVSELVTEYASTPKGNQPGWLKRIRDRFNADESPTPLADLIILRAHTNAERWSDQRWVATPKRLAHIPETMTLASQTEAALRRVEGIAGPDDAPGLTPTDAAIVGRTPRQVPEDFTQRTGIDPDNLPDVDEAARLRDSRARVVIDPADEVTQRAHQRATGRPERRSASLDVVNDVEPTLRRQWLERRRLELQSQRDTLAAGAAQAREGAAPRPAVPEAPELPFPADLMPLWTRYMGDALAEAMGQPPPRTIREVYDAIRSIDYGFDGRPGDILLPEELAALREGLLRYANGKLDEWKVPAEPPLQRVQGRLTPEGAAGATPAEHEVFIEQLVTRLQDKLFVTDDPLEGYLGVGYEFIPPPAKSIEGGELTTRLFWESNLTDQLVTADRVIPGMGEELARGRMESVPSRVQATNDHYAAQAIAQSSFLTRLRNAYDMAFGPRSQRDIDSQAFERFATTLLRIDDETATRILADPVAYATHERAYKVLRGLLRYWHDEMRELKFGPLPFSTYRRIGLLRSSHIERLTQQYLEGQGEAGELILSNIRAMQAAGEPTPVWAAWREADNRIRAWFAQRPGGVAEYVERLYEGPVRRVSEGMAGLTVAYHVYRFLLDARWLAMEALEMPTLVVGREGPGGLIDAYRISKDLKAGKTPEMLFQQGDVVQQLAQHWAWWMSQGDPGGYMRWRQAGLLAVVQRTAQRGMVKELERMARSDPRLSALVRSNGDTPLQYLRRLDRDWQTMATRGRPMEESQLRATLEPYVADGVLAPAELEEFVKQGRWYEHPGLEAAIAHAGDPVTRALMRRLQVTVFQAWNEGTGVIFGQVDRSNMQRLLNHPLLYWPISYQIKATRWLAGVLLDRAFGVETGSLGAVTLGMIWEKHKQALADDPEFREFLRRNDTLLFIAQMLVPITPMDLGVSLSPFTRIVHSIVTGSDVGSNEPYRRNIFNVGTGYTVWDLLPRFLEEQATEPGLAGDIAERLGFAFPRTIMLDRPDER